MKGWEHAALFCSAVSAVCGAYWRLLNDRQTPVPSLQTSQTKKNTYSSVPHHQTAGHSSCSSSLNHTVRTALCFQLSIPFYPRSWNRTWSFHLYSLPTIDPFRPPACPRGLNGRFCSFVRLAYPPAPNFATRIGFSTCVRTQKLKAFLQTCALPLPPEGKKRRVLSAPSTSTSTTQCRWFVRVNRFQIMGAPRYRRIVTCFTRGVGWHVFLIFPLECGPTAAYCCLLFRRYKKQT